MTDRLDVRLRVGLKGADPVVNTAYLTLVEKMGYQGKLFAINRLESYAFNVPTEDAASTLGRLTRFLSTTTVFYNRNKHNYFLDCQWRGHRHGEGATLESLESFSAQLAMWAEVDNAQDSGGQRTPGRVIFRGAPVYRTEILVEDIEDTGTRSLAALLESELGVSPVTMTELGIRWHLALGVESDAEAERVAEEIAVTKSRNHGLLLNPNYQRYKLLSVEQIELG
jgi:hypothetical protein